MLRAIVLSGLAVLGGFAWITPVAQAGTAIETPRCSAYRDFLSPSAAGFAAGPDRQQYGARHALPALALYARDEGNAALGEGIKATLRHYSDWIDSQIATRGGVQSFEGATLLPIYARELRAHGQFDRSDEAWLRDTLLKLRRFSFGLRPGDGPWRGSQHRGMVDGTNNLVAAALYPAERQAPTWRATGERVWNDWWRYRDVGVNDIAYFSDSLSIMLRAADIVGRDEVFSDPQVKENLWNRLVFETSPDGALIPYGASAGWHGLAGVRIYALELAARKTGDGRYRNVAGKLFDYARTHGGFSPGQAHWQAISTEAVALAALACDDRVTPVEPAGGSKVLYRPEIVRLTPAEVRARVGAGAFDADMDMTAVRMPSKLTLRSGWARGDMFMLVEAFARHDPLNPTAIVGLERYGASFAEMNSEKDVVRGNALAIAPLDGPVAELPTGYAGMTSSVEAFGDGALASHARLAVSRYGGHAARVWRDFLFVKNRFVLLRDEVQADAPLRARIGPVWNTQNIDRRRGANWVDSWFTAHWYNGSVRLYVNPPGRLLIWHAPRADARLSVAPERRPDVADDDQRAALKHFLSEQYAWTGTAARGQRLQFATLLVPHLPGTDGADLARRIRVLRDEPGLVAIGFDGPDGYELTLLNPAARNVTLTTPSGEVRTDAEAAYVRLGDKPGVAGWRNGGTTLTLAGRPLEDRLRAP